MPASFDFYVSWSRGDHPWREANKYLDGRYRAKIGYMTWLIRDHHSSSISVRHHDTDIITYEPDGTVIVDVNGWYTPTTKQRVNALSPLSIYQKSGAWMIANKHGPDVPYEEPVIIRPEDYGSIPQDLRPIRGLIGR